MLELWFMVFIEFGFWFTNVIDERQFKINFCITIILIVLRLIRKEIFQKK